MLSQNHSMNWIHFWLSQWVRDINIKAQLEIVMDGSAALIGAAIAAFTQCRTTNDYLSACMDSLKNGKSPPETLMRIDRSHFVKSIHRNVRKGFSKTVKLIRGVLGYLISCENFAENERIIHALFTLIRNEFNSPAVKECANMLRNLVMTHKVDDIFDTIQSATDDISRDISEKHEIIQTYIKLSMGARHFELSSNI